MSRTGNHTSAPQFLYILWNVPFVWIVKIGIGGKLKKRTRQVGKSAPGLDIPVFVTWVVCAYQLEQFIHRLCAPFRLELGRRWGTGRTERFLFPSLLIGVVVAVAWTVVCWGSIGIVLYAIIQSI